MTYTQINNEILNTPHYKGGLNGFELLVCIYSLKSQSNSNFMFSIERICKHYNLGRLVITKAIQSLEAKGLLRREFYHDEKGYRRVFYRVADTFAPCNNNFKNDTMALSNDKQEKPQETNSNTLKAPAEIKQKIEQNIKQETQEKPKNTAEHIGQKVRTYDEIMQEQITEKADFIYRNFNANDELSFETWLDWAKYKQSINKLDIVALELVLKQSINTLNSFKDRANEAIEYSIAGGYKQLFLPKIDETKQEQKSKDLPDNVVTRAGITIPVRYELFTQSINYLGVDYNKEFWDIIKCTNPNELSKFLLDGWDVEVRKHLNEIIDLRTKFLENKKE